MNKKKTLKKKNKRQDLRHKVRSLQEYKNELPKLRQKIATVAFLLMLSVVMSTGVSFAWLVLSRSPEVTNVNTTFAANGSLEIALARPDGSQPGASAVGDSFAVNENGVDGANRTWGNLVNLSDPMYGLSNMILRPATLNGKTGLLTSPLYSATYGEDGRYEGQTTADDFSYVYYAWDEDAKQYVFKVDADSKNYGVRAISTVKWVNLGGDEAIRELASKASSNLNNAKNRYALIVDDKTEPGKTYISSLQGLIQTYAQKVIDGTPDNQLVIDSKFLQALYDMLEDIYNNVMVPCGESYLAMANLCAFKETGKITEYTIDTLCTVALANKLPSHINIASLKQFATDRKQMIEYLDASKTNSLAYWNEQYKGGNTVYWSNISRIINWVCDINTCTVSGYTINQVYSHATELVGKTNPVVIKNGCLYRVEKRIGQTMNNPLISITVDLSSKGGLIGMMGKKTLKATISTAANDLTTFEMPAEIEAVRQSSGWIKGTDGIAEDTYAYAIDFWVRTNASESYLSLEGNILTEERTIRSKDRQGHELYIASWTDDEGNTQTEKVYKGENNSYYYSDSEEHFTVASLGVAVSYVEAYETVTVVVGYEGDDRIWSDDRTSGLMVAGTATTQGSGSCYVFYADNSADQERFLKLLANVKVVFIDESGTKMATAIMDTEHHYAENGKVTVPLVLSEADSLTVGDKRYITQLRQNEATRITALVYLDGESVSNSMVLSSSEVEGTLNIQFGSSKAPLNSMGNDELMGKHLSLTASISKNEFIFDPNNTAVAGLRVNVEGEIAENSKLIARFVRRISDTYGSWQQEMVLHPAGENIWIGDYPFNYPGTYILRSIWVDGNEYQLEEPISVDVTGELIGALSFADTTARAFTKMTAESSFSTKIKLAYCTQQTAKIVFVDENNNRVTVDMKRDNGGEGLSGTASFRTSGIYTAKFYYVDGQEYEIDPTNSLSLELYLGLKSSTYITCVPDALTLLNLVQSGSTPSNFVVPDSGSLRRESLVSTLLDEISKNSVLAEHYASDKQTVDTLRDALKNGTTVDGLDKTALNSLATLKTQISDLLASENEGIQTFALTKDQLDDTNRPLLYDLVDDLTLLGRLCDSADKIHETISDMGGGSITLNVSTKIYDNSGKEITDLKSVNLYYTKSGSSLGEKGLESAMRWNGETQSYEGNFLVHNAGVYNFDRITVTIDGEESVITRFTSAPSVRAMPPADAYYYDHADNATYQYAPTGNAAMTVNIAYSGAASRVVANILSTDGRSYPVNGRMLHEFSGANGVSVNAWAFTVPSNGEGYQDGRWTLDSITMYGVYYNGNYYEDSGEGVTVDLSGEAIQTKAVENIFVTVDGKSQLFTGYFMDSHPVNDMTVTIADFEGGPIQGVTIADVKIKYDLDASDAAFADYGYTISNKSSLATKGSAFGSATLTAGSKTKYAVSGIDFKYAGDYNACTVSLTIEGRNITVGSSNDSYPTKLSYYNNGSRTDNCAVYTVRWVKPVVEFTATNPAVGTEFDGDPKAKSDKKAVKVKNQWGYTDGTKDSTGQFNITSTDAGNRHFGVVVYYKAGLSCNTITSYTATTGTVKLSNAGSSFTNATCKIVSKGYPNQFDSVFTFTPTSLTNKQDLGGKDGSSRRVLGQGAQAKTIVLTYDGLEFTFELENPLTVTGTA